MEEYNEPSNLSDQKKELQRLLESRGWGMIVSTIQSQVDTLQSEILFGPVIGPDDLYRLERKKGMLEGRLSLQATLQDLIENLGIDLERAISKKESKE